MRQPSEVQICTINRGNVGKVIECELGALPLHDVEETAPWLIATSEVVSDAVPPHPVILWAAVKCMHIFVETLGIDFPEFGVPFLDGNGVSTIVHGFSVDGSAKR